MGPSVWLAMLDEGRLCFLRRTAIKGSGACSDGSAEPGSLGPLLGAGTCSCPRLGSVSWGLAGRAAASAVLSFLRCCSFCSTLGALLWLQNPHWWGHYEGAPRRMEAGLGSETQLDLKLGSFPFFLKFFDILWSFIYLNIYWSVVDLQLCVGY